MFSQETADTICQMLADGMSLRKACDELSIKHPTWLLWVSESKELADQYARAREAGQNYRFERLNEKAAAEPERDDKGRIDPGWVAWKRLEIDTEKWTLSKQEPKKYGDKLQTEVTGNLKHDHTVGLSAETAELLASLKAGSSDSGDAAAVQD
jgi:hypothetical protein